MFCRQQLIAYEYTDWSVSIQEFDKDSRTAISVAIPTCMAAIKLLNGRKNYLDCTSGAIPWKQAEIQLVVYKPNAEAWNQVC